MRRLSLERFGRIVSADGATVILVGVFAAAVAASVMVLHRELVFDDAFISYRYARNLAAGHGLVWNPGEAPVEGFTNLLLVLLLVPWMWLGADPLLATRIMSFAAAFGIVVLLAREARLAGFRPAASMLFAATFVTASSVAALCMVGLETVLYAFFLLLSFHFVHSFAERGRVRDLALSNGAGFAALLLRPEALLLTGILWGFVLQRRPASRRIRFAARHLAPTYLLPLAAYAAWKLATFGSLLPNSFYLKVSGVGLLADQGVASVLGFVSAHAIPLAAALLSPLFVRRPDEGRLRAAAAVFVAAYALFYLRVETLMEIHGRFLFPAAPFVWVLAAPTIGSLFEACLRRPRHGVSRLALVAGVILLVFAGNPVATVNRLRAAARGVSADPWGLDRRKVELGRALSRYEGIEGLRIANGDAGAIPYFSHAKHLDVVGLNDAFISRERNLRRLTDYFFEARPDLVLHPARRNDGWLREGHGPLGDYAAWALDRRWDAYAYVGTVRLVPYDLHLLLRKDHPDFQRLSRFLRRHAVDRIDPELPLPLGSHRPQRAPRRR